MVIIKVRNNTGVIGRCDAKCHNAVTEDCHCVCGGAFHGVGERIAREDRNHITDEEIRSILCTAKGAVHVTIKRPPIQMELFK